MRLHSHPAGNYARPTMAFIPWEAMTPLQQAEHLVHAHGFDIEYVDTREPDLIWYGARTDQQVVEGFLALMDETGRRIWHGDDHQEYPHGGADRCLHTHDKPVPDEDGGPYGRCDTCGSPCDTHGCTTDPTHPAALEA